MTAPISVKRLDPRAKLPAYGSADAAGADLYALTGGPEIGSASCRERVCLYV